MSESKFQDCEACDDPQGTLRHEKVWLCFSCNRSARVACWSKIGHPKPFRPYVSADGVKITGYQCKLCGLWHGTSAQDQERFELIGSDHMRLMARLDWAISRSGFSRGLGKVEHS